MKLIPVLSTIALLASAPAWGAAEVQPCADANVGLEAVVTPVAKNASTFYDGKVTIYNIDRIEPACCSGGLAVVLPDVKDELGSATCFALVGIGSIDINKAKTAGYDPKKGLLLALPTSTIGEDGKLMINKTLKLRINLGDSTVKLEP